MEITNIIIGVFILILGVPLGDYLARITKEELKQGQRWFKIVIVKGLIVGFIGLIFANDVVMFSCFFMAIVTSRSLKK